MSEISYESLAVTISYRIYHVQGKWMGVCPILGKTFSGPTPDIVKLEIMKEAALQDKTAISALLAPKMSKVKIAKESGEVSSVA